MFSGLFQKTVKKIFFSYITDVYSYSMDIQWLLKFKILLVFLLFTEASYQSDSKTSIFD